MIPLPPVRSLMAEAIDYAGLFPPAALPMAEAVANFDRYRRGAHAWMLGRFVVPLSRLEELADAYASVVREESPPWRVSVIARASDAAAVAAFNSRYGARLRIDTIEVPPVTVADVAALAGMAASYAVFAEVPWASDPGPIIAELARHGVRAKIRTGGIKPEAIPSPANVARFIAVCVEAKVPFKATAGLHHTWRGEYPLTYESDSASATMFGFANVLLASSAAVAGAGADEIAAMLDSPAGAGFEAWEQGWVLPSGRAIPEALVAAARRQAMESFGSCSFEEPVEELSARGLL